MIDLTMMDQHLLALEIIKKGGNLSVADVKQIIREYIKAKKLVNGVVVEMEAEECQR